MLDNSSLAQLKQLKTEIRETERRYEGTVSGSSGTYGFVHTENKEQFFLPPPQMQRVFPGDRIDFQVIAGKDGKDSAEVKRLIKSSFKQFCGQVVQRGKGWFVDVDEPGMIRQLFLPPQQRKNIKAGDWLSCKVSRHPIKDGKAQASIIEKISEENQADFPSTYVKHLKRLPETIEKQDLSFEDKLKQQLDSDRKNLCDLPFVTIDAPTTRDMDDALFARQTDQGWELFIAIADPASLVEAGSNLDKVAEKVAASCYLPHFKLPMLPTGLSEGLLSLAPDNDRLAVVCRLLIDSNGAVIEETFTESVVRSHAKLSYEQVSVWLENGFDSDTDQALVDSLKALDGACDSLLAHRKQHQLVARDKPEFNYTLNDNGRIASFVPANSGKANRLVQEAMLATNQAAARLLAEQGGGLFTAHGGFRSERLADALALLAGCGIEGLDNDKLRSLEGYQQAIGQLGTTDKGAHAVNILSRFLQRSQLSPSPLPHLGLGVPCYLNFTSPIRRYVDLVNHRQLKSLAKGQSIETWDDARIAALSDVLDRQRAAAYIAEKWLMCEYLERNLQERFSGTISQMNKFATTIRLDDTGIEGIIENRQLKGNFDISNMTLAYESGQWTLDDRVDVTVKRIDKAKRVIELAPCQ